MRLNQQIAFQWFSFLLLLSAAACAGQPVSAPVATLPGISVQITRDTCPSIEAQAGSQINWTNQDTVDRAVILERTNEQGEVVDSGGTSQLQPGATFSITLSEPGGYTYYCSPDRTAFGTITVLPISYPYP